MVRFDRDNISFFVTLETLEVIVEGLQMKLGDTSLAICSAGCVPLALSRFGKVVAVDKSQTQLRYAEWRRSVFVDGCDIVPFQYQGVVKADRVQRYFSNIIDEIRKNAGNISFVRRDLFKCVPNGGFDKVYLSNILNWSLHPEELQQRMLQRIIRKMPRGGIICAVNLNEDYSIPNTELVKYVEPTLRENFWDCSYSFYRVAPKNL